MVSEIGASSEWRSTSASQRGSSHGPDGINQDAVTIEELVDAAGTSTWVAAVSDGHGGSRYVRSDTGAQVAASVAVAEVGRLLAAGHSFDADLMRTAAPLIVDAWRADVLAHLAQHPFTDEESARAGTTPDAKPLVAYGATLLLAAISDTGVLLAQIGDGDALVRTHGFALRPVPGDLRLVANETTSLCMDTAAADFRFAELPDSAEVDLVMLSSDGYGNSFAANDWWHKLVGDLAWYVDVHGFDAFATHLPEWLAESARVGGDDVTAAVLTRPLAAQVPAAVVDPPLVGRTLVDETPVETPVETPSDDPIGTLDTSRGSGSAEVSTQRRRRRALLISLLVALLVSVASFVGVRLLAGNGAPSDVVPPGDTATPTSTASTAGDGSTDIPPAHQPKNPPTNPGPQQGGGPPNPPGGGTKDGGTPKP